MNYYPFHIGDYARRTRHLTWDEDLAYRRLLDLYYTTEAPLPREVEKVCRLVVATTKRQRQAVQAVLDEFFEMTAEGWVNRRADEEIASMKARQAETEQKNSHESDRMKRYRDRRQAMFAALREVGVIPPWDIKIRDLERLYKEHVEEPATDLQRNSDVSGDAPATAIPIPIPVPTPTPKKVGKNPPNPPRCALPDWIDPDAWAAWKRHRRAIRKPLTPDAEALSLRELAKMRGDGFDPKAVIENAILKGWQGLYPPKDAQSPPAPRPRRESVVEHNERAFDEWEKSFDDGRTLDA